MPTQLQRHGPGMGNGGQSMASKALRLGFPVKVLSLPDVKSNDTRRWANNPHLKVSLSTWT